MEIQNKDNETLKKELSDLKKKHDEITSLLISYVDVLDNIENYSTLIIEELNKRNKKW